MNPTKLEQFGLEVASVFIKIGACEVAFKLIESVVADRPVNGLQWIGKFNLRTIVTVIGLTILCVSRR